MRVAFIAVLAAIASAQTQPAFDIADVHVSPGTAAGPRLMLGPNRSGLLAGGRYQLHRATMVELIRTAYGVEPDNVVGGPSWLEMDRFDVIAKAPVATSQESVRLMLQTLLADRFKLAIHKETRPLPAFVLTLGKGKPKMKEADGSGETGCRPQPPSGSQPYPVQSCRNMTMEAFVARLRQSAAAYLPSPVIDSTGLKGTWNFDVGWTGKMQLARLGPDGSVCSTRSTNNSG